MVLTFGSPQLSTLNASRVLMGFAQKAHEKATGLLYSLSTCKHFCGNKIAPEAF